jgi:hypothetical protein
MRVCTEVMLAGFAPFAPWHDYHYQLALKDNEKLSIEDYYNYSIAWLKVSDTVLLIDGWQLSTGAINERDIAEQLNIPIFYSLEDLINYYEE